MADIPGTMLDYVLHNFAVISVPFTVVVAIVNILRYFREQKGLAFIYTFLDDDELRSNEAIEKVKLLSSTDPQTRISLRKLHLRNSGNQPIRREDFDGNFPIEVRFDDRTVEFASVIRCKPSNLRPVLRQELNKVNIEPLLLNGKDWFELELVLTGVGLSYDIETRIAGIREPKEDPGRLLRLVLSGVRTLSVTVAAGLLGAILVRLANALFSNIGLAGLLNSIESAFGFLSNAGILQTLSLVVTLVSAIYPIALVVISLLRRARRRKTNVPPNSVDE